MSVTNGKKTYTFVTSKQSSTERKIADKTLTKKALFNSGKWNEKTIYPNNAKKDFFKGPLSI
jgi:hypothetical protein